MITKTTIQESKVGEKKGWSFSIYWENRPYPNLVSALYLTEEEAQSQLNRFIDTGKYDWYGTAE